jgi:hypothetical protein
MISKATRRKDDDKFQTPSLLPMISPSFGGILMTDDCADRSDMFLSLMSITAMLMEASCIRAYQSYHHQRHFHIRTQTQTERAAVIRLPRFVSSNEDAATEKVLKGDAVLEMLDQWHETV